MKYLFTIEIQNETFNKYVLEGTAGQKIGRCVEETSPETLYFTSKNGLRTALAVYDLKESSEIPAKAEPWFLSFNATVDMQPLMTPEDLKASKLDELGKKWA